MDHFKTRLQKNIWLVTSVIMKHGRQFVIIFYVVTVGVGLLLLRKVNPAVFFKTKVAPLDITRRVAGVLGKNVGSLMPRLPEKVAGKLGFPEKSYACQSSARIGRIGDGGRNICLDHISFGNSECVVYSFGVNFDFSFDKAMAILGCKVHSFDPYMLLQYPPTPWGWVCASSFSLGLKFKFTVKF